MGKPRKRKAKIKLRERALIQKKDNTNVARPDTTRYPRAATQLPRDNAVVFKVKLKKK